MRKFLLGSVALFALSAGSPALAADMPVKARPVPPPAVYSWSGCYGGGFVGYGWGKSQHRSLDPRQYPGFDGPFPPGLDVSESDFSAVSGDITPSFDMSGALGGFNVGCQAQFGWWLIGIEGDGAVTNKDGQAFNNFLGFNDRASKDPQPQPFFVSQTTERWLATARLRLGWAADKWLFFVTGGGAWSGVEVTVWDSLTPAVTAHHKKTLSGWTAGAGWEYALGYGWSWKSEFLYVDFGWTKFFDPADTCSPSCDAFLNPREVNLKNYIFRTGLNYKFDWGWGKAPVAVMAKY